MFSFWRSGHKSPGTFSHASRIRIETRPFYINKSRSSSGIKDVPELGCSKASLRSKRFQSSYSEFIPFFLLSSQRSRRTRAETLATQVTERLVKKTQGCLCEIWIQIWDRKKLTHFQRNKKDCGDKHKEIQTHFWKEVKLILFVCNLMIGCSEKRKRKLSAKMFLNKRKRNLDYT